MIVCKTKRFCDIFLVAKHIQFDNKSLLFLAQTNRTTPVPNPLSASVSAPPQLPSPEKPDPEGTLVCQICFENFNGNWGLVHGRTMHAGYCEGCAEKLKKDKLPCPQCRSDIEAIIKVFMN